jgi:hypothetical protein
MTRPNPDTLKKAKLRTLGETPPNSIINLAKSKGKMTLT